tara:strand:+ start:270 stop:1409 length:1140 start_codon:yes stop_codon:yes gene_type:complete
MRIYNSKIKTISLLFLLVCSTLFNSYAQNERPAHLGFIYPISTNGLDAAKFSNNLSIHALAGLSGGENGLSIYGLAGMVQGNATGLQVAGLYSKLRGDLTGVQIAGLMNQAQNANNGVQIAGIANFLEKDTPVQIAGILNKARNVQGFQNAGIVNISALNRGAQIAGIANLTKKIEGAQIAGIFNEAENVKGIQIVGIVNKAKKVDGVQLSGIVNIAESSDYPIGIINLIEDGEIRIGLSSDENLTTMLSFKSGGRRLYGIVGIGSNLQYGNLPYALEAGLGLKVLEGNSFRLDIEGTNMFATNFKKGGEYTRSGIKVLPALLISQNLQIFAGPSLNYTHTKYSNGNDLSGMQLWSRERRGVYKAVHLGVTAGVNIRIN